MTGKNQVESYDCSDTNPSSQKTTQTGSKIVIVPNDFEIQQLEDGAAKIILVSCCLFLLSVGLKE